VNEEYSKFSGPFSLENWESLQRMLGSMDPNDNTWYMFTVNKGKSNEYRTKFLTYQEAHDLIDFAIRAKRMRISVENSLP